MTLNTDTNNFTSMGELWTISGADLTITRSPRFIGRMLMTWHYYVCGQSFAECRILLRNEYTFTILVLCLRDSWNIDVAHYCFYCSVVQTLIKSGINFGDWPNFANVMGLIFFTGFSIFLKDYSNLGIISFINTNSPASKMRMLSSKSEMSERHGTKSPKQSVDKLPHYINNRKQRPFELGEKS